MPSSSPSPPRALARGRFLDLLERDGWEYAERPGVHGVVAIVPVTSEGELVLISQHRIPVGRRVVELPAGLAGDEPRAESGAESLAEAAARELEEETGYRARRLERCFEMPSSAGLTSETVVLFLATDVVRVSAGGGDGHERIAVHVVPLAEVPAWLQAQAAAGALIDGKIYAGLYLLSARG